MFFIWSIAINACLKFSYFFGFVFVLLWDQNTGMFIQRGYVENITCIFLKIMRYVFLIHSHCWLSEQKQVIWNVDSITVFENWHLFVKKLIIFCRWSVLEQIVERHESNSTITIFRHTLFTIAIKRGSWFILKKQF